MFIQPNGFKIEGNLGVVDLLVHGHVYLNKTFTGINPP